jgi:hypothetical protein
MGKEAGRGITGVLLEYGARKKDRVLFIVLKEMYKSPRVDYAIGIHLRTQ